MPAMLEFGTGGIDVMADPADNDAGHDVPHHESGTRISFEVQNVGDIGGNATVRLELDRAFITDSQSSSLDRAETEVGFVGLGRLSEGSHLVDIVVNPGSGRADHQTNTRAKQYSIQRHRLSTGRNE
jgi:hypothetical protein